MTVRDSVLVVIDIQDKLLAKIPRKDELVRNAGFLLDVANTVGVPALATEQYPKGLGQTTSAIIHRLPPNIPPKTSFSCCGATGFSAELHRLQRRNVILAGMETHVCVQQTAIDLLGFGFGIFLAVDALASRHEIDHQTAIRRLELAGAVPTTVESIAFEWVGDATQPTFKAVSQLVIERAASLTA